MRYLNVVYRFAPADVPVATGHLRALVAASRAEPGCRIYEVHRHATEPGTFLIYEAYDDENALAAHRASSHYADHGTAGLQALARSRDVGEYLPLGEDEA